MCHVREAAYEQYCSPLEILDNSQVQYAVPIEWQQLLVLHLAAGLLFQFGGQLAGAPHPAVSAHGAGSGTLGAPLLILLQSRLLDGNAVAFCLTYGIMVANLTGVRGRRGEREYQKNSSSKLFHIFSPKVW
jgi:hypothetical protein